MFATQFDAKNKLWSGRDNVPFYNPKINVAQVVLKACLTHGSKIAQISDNSGIQLTYDDIRLKIIRAAQNLQKLGYGQGQVFGCIAKNSHHLAPIVFSSMAIGCAINTLDPTFLKPEILHMLEIIKPTLLFCDVEALDLVKECLIELGHNARIFTFGGSKDGSDPVENLFVETHNESDFVPVKVDGMNDTAAITCSSGTTGLSKGVCLSHEALLTGSVNFDAITSNDVILCFSSLYWITGWLMLLSGTINGSTRILTTEPFTPELQLRLIEDYKVTCALNAPYHLALISKCDRIQQTDLSSLKCSLSGGGKCPKFVQTSINSHLPNGKVCVIYGLSESAGAITMNMSEKDSVGQMINCYTIKIIDEDGNRCGVGEDGEICFKANFKFLGYYGNQQATDEALDEEGFFLTADIGHFDEDGDLFVVDRKKDILKYRGFQISPSQIESHLTKLPDIKSVCVIGIPDDDNGTELPAAFIVLKENSNITEKDVFDAVAGHFADYCKLRGGVHFVDALPMTPSGKFLRRKVREMAIELKN